MSEKPSYKELERRIQELEHSEFAYNQSKKIQPEDKLSYRSLLHNIQAAVVVHGADTKIIASNSTAQELLGLTEYEMLGKKAIHPDWKFFNADNKKLPFELYPVNQVLNTRQTLRDKTFGIYRPNMLDSVWVLVNADPVFDETKEIKQVIVTFMNITDRKRIEEALEESKKRLAEAQQLAKFGHYIFDIRNDCWTSSDQLDDIFGIDNERKKTMGSWLQIIHPDHMEMMSNYLQDNILTQHQKFDKEYKIFNRKTRKEMWVHGLGTLKFDKNNHPVEMFGTIQDITARKQAEEIFKEHQQLYRALFEKNTSIILLIDPKTADIIDANPSACLFYGHSKKTITSMKISDINILTKKQVQIEMNLAESEQRNYFNFRHILSDGSIRDVEVYSGPISVGGKHLLCSIIHDISERKTNEKERERLINDLQNALDEIKTLKGIVPICSSCKKIRDDKGYWNLLESYIEKHSDASFSHSICPDCANDLYGNEDWYHGTKGYPKKNN